MNKTNRLILLGAGMLTATAIAFAFAKGMPGYRINDAASVNRAVHQYADDCDKFGAVIYQAGLDKDLWQLTIAAHAYYRSKPSDAERECSFVNAYWGLRDRNETIPPDAAKQLEGMYGEAVDDTEDVAHKLPDSMTAHLVYGRYMLLHVMGMAKVKPMLAEFRKAVMLRPDSGTAHYWLAQGLAGSGDYSRPTADATIREAKKAIRLDPRLSESYYLLATAYELPSEDNRKMSEIYLNKYLKIHPERANIPDIAGFRKWYSEKPSH